MLFFLRMFAPADRIEEERERQEPAHELGERELGGVMRIACLLDGPEDGDAAEYPDRDQLRLRYGVEALHTFLAFRREDKDVHQAYERAREAGPECVYLEAGLIFLGLSVSNMLLCAGAWHKRL